MTDKAIANFHAFKRAILAALPPASRDALRDPTTGYSRLTIRAIITYMDQQFGIITDVDVALYTAKLDLPFVDGCEGGFAGHITAFKNAARWLEQNAEPVAPGKLYMHFRDSIATCGLFTVQQVMWNGMPGHQPFLRCRLLPVGTDVGFYAYMQAAYDSLPHRATTGTHRYAAAATTAAPAAAAPVTAPITP